VRRARCGQRLSPEDFTEPPPIAEIAAWLDGRGRLVAVGTREADDRFVLHRGFVEERP
jgi:hypothetical protein